MNLSAYAAAVCLSLILLDSLASDDDVQAQRQSPFFELLRCHRRASGRVLLNRSFSDVEYRRCVYRDFATSCSSWPSSELSKFVLAPGPLSKTSLA